MATILHPEHVWHIGQIPDIDPRTLRVRVRSIGAWDCPSLPRRPRWLEREHELERVRAALRAVGRRSGQVLVIEGAAGLGKSRLLEQARAAAPDLGVRVLAGTGDEVRRA